MIYKKRILFIAISFALASPALQAEIVNPIFSGKRYVGANYQGEDNCGMSQFKYDSYGKTPGEMALEYLNKHEPQSTCTWTITSSGSGAQVMPVDFPGDFAQWTTVSEQNPLDGDYNVNAACITPSHTIQTNELVTAYPQYICHAPESRYGVDSQTGKIGCTTTPNLCNGDVVGRDLDGLGPLGHVGLTSSDGYITQVMKDHSTLIEMVSFDQFKAATTYWGDKYGLSETPTYTLQQGQLILQAEIDQYNGLGSYELEPIFVPLQTTQVSVYSQSTKEWQQQVSYSYPMFRCDTFVDWVYYVGLKQMALPFHEIDSVDGYKAYEYDNYLNDPKTLYDALLNIRYNGLDLTSASKSSIQATSSNLVIGNAINYLTNPNISRTVKIQKYWEEYNSSDSTNKALAFNGLMFLAPTNLIPTFIDKFNTDPTHQADYLNLIIAGMQVKPQYVAADDISNIVAGQNFFAEQIQSQTNPALLKTIIYGYNAFMPYSAEKASIINNAINRLAEIKNVDPRSLFEEQFMLSINDPSGNSVNHLIGDLKSSQYQQQFNQFIVAQIQDGLNATMLTNPNQSEVSGYLLQQIQQIQAPSSLKESKNFSADNVREIQNYNLIKAYGLFTNNPAYMANTIISTEDVNLQASLITLALADPWAHDTQEKLKSDKKNLIQHLNYGQALTSNSSLIKQPPASLEIQAAVNNLNK